MNGSLKKDFSFVEATREVFCIEGILENMNIFGADVWAYVKQSLFPSSLSSLDTPRDPL